MTTVTSVIATSIAQPPPTPIPPTPGPSCAAWDAGCQAGQIAQTGFQSLVAEIARGTGQFVVSATTWWTTTPSVDPLDPAVGHAQTLLQPLSLAILVGSILAQAIRMMISRKGDPLVQVLLGLVRYAVTAGLGLTILHAALNAGDALATGILDDAPAKFAQLLQAMLLANPTNLWGVLLLSSIATVLAVVQWLLMELRQAGLLVLAAMLTLAASGSLNRATRAWLDRLIGWLLAIVAYKPAAAFIYYLGFSYLSPRAGAPGNLGTILTGVLVLRPGGRGDAGLAEVLLLVGHPARRLRRQRLRNARRRGSGRAGPGRARPGRRPRRRPHGCGGPGGCPVAAAGAAAAAGRGAVNQFTGAPRPGGGQP